MCSAGTLRPCDLAWSPSFGLPSVVRGRFARCCTLFHTFRVLGRAHERRSVWGRTRNEPRLQPKIRARRGEEGPVGCPVDGSFHLGSEDGQLVPHDRDLELRLSRRALGGTQRAQDALQDQMEGDRSTAWALSQTTRWGSCPATTVFLYPTRPRGSRRRNISWGRAACERYQTAQQQVEDSEEHGAGPPSERGSDPTNANRTGDRRFPCPSGRTVEVPPRSGQEPQDQDVHEQGEERSPYHEQPVRPLPPRPDVSRGGAGP